MPEFSARTLTPDNLPGGACGACGAGGLMGGGGRAGAVLVPAAESDGGKNTFTHTRKKEMQIYIYVWAALSE